LLHNYQDIAEDPELRERYQIPASAFINDPLFSKGDSDLTVHSYDLTHSDRDSFCLWTDGSFFSNALNIGAAAAIWDHGYDSIPKATSSTQPQSR
jgi:hypothetical protein